jgi:lipid-binding SYLF domain-containing protein
MLRSHSQLGPARQVLGHVAMNIHRRTVRAAAVEAGLVMAALSLGACASSSEPKSAAEMQKKQSEEDVRLDKSTDLIGQFRPKIPDNAASRARCLVIVPGLQKGGLVVGGEGGKGFATCASRGAWSAPAPIKMGGGTVGAQIGYTSGDALALVVSDSAARALEAGNFKIGASASAAAGPVGTGASATGDVGVKSDILTYTQQSGLFAGATLNGMTISSDDEATHALYGVQADLASILERRVTPPQSESVQRFLGAVNGAFPPSAISLGGAGAAAGD